MYSRTSRRRFTDYLAQVAGRRKHPSADRMDGTPGDVTKKHPPRSFGQLFLAFLQLLGEHRRPVIWALLTLTVATILRLAPPAATKLAIDYVLLANPLPSQWAEWLPPDLTPVQMLLWIAGGALAISFVSTLLHLSGRWHATRAVNRVQVSLRKKVFEHAVRLPLHKVHQLKTGGATSLLREDTGGAAELIFSMMYNPWRAVVQLIGSLLVLMYVDWRMMVGGLILVPIVYFTHRTWINRIRPLYRDVRTQRQDIDAYTTEAFGGIRVVRGFGRQRSETNRFVRNNDLLVRQQLYVWWWSRIIDVIWDTLVPLASTGLLVYGGYRILTGEMTLGDLTMFLFYLAMLLEPLATLASSATSFQNNLAGLDRILDLLDESREMPSRPTSVAVAPEEVAGRVTLDGVSFRYPESDHYVLREITLDVQPGETIALVGRSGAGKTTLCNLIARFHDPSEGRVLLDGRDLRDIHVENYRRLLGIVEQDVFLFDGTIAENIGYGQRGARREEIEEAAQAANAHGFIQRLERGYDTVIGERGVRLSGGQRQRLAIARALLADPKILILDEATSNLDTESEQLIQRSLQTLMRGRTSFVIAHRMSTVALADRIAVLDDGELVELGTHEELMAASSRYRRMVELQTGMDVAAS